MSKKMQLDATIYFKFQQTGDSATLSDEVNLPAKRWSIPN